MEGPKYQYTKELYKRFGYTAIWTPAVPVKLGDVGVMDGNVFRYVSELEKFNIPFGIRRGTGSEDLVYTSASGVAMNFKAAGSPVVGGSSLLVNKAGATIDFQKGAGVVFVAKDCVTTVIEDQIALKNELARRYNLAQWDATYYVITELKQAASMSAFISESAGGKMEIIAENSLSIGTVNLADLDAGLSVGAFSGINTQVLAGEKLTPLFIAKKLKVGWLRGTSFETTGISDDMQLHDIEKLPPDVEITEENTKFAEFVPDFEKTA